MLTDDELKAAWDRIARTPDGQLAYLHLQRRLMAVRAAGDDSTLREDNGERKFASALMGLMAEGIRESGGRSDSICTFAVAGPVAVVGPRGPGRRVTVDTPVAGWDTAVPAPGAKPDIGDGY